MFQRTLYFFFFCHPQMLLAREQKGCFVMLLQQKIKSTGLSIQETDLNKTRRENLSFLYNVDLQRLGHIEICKHICCFWHSRPWQQKKKSHWGFQPIPPASPKSFVFTTQIIVMHFVTARQERYQTANDRTGKTMQLDFSLKKKKNNKKGQSENIMKIYCSLHLVNLLMLLFKRAKALSHYEFGCSAPDYNP